MLDRGSVATLVRVEIEARIVQQAKVNAETKKPRQLELLGPFLGLCLALLRIKNDFRPEFATNT